MAVMLGIGEHSPYFRVRTQVVAFMIAAVGVPEWICGEVNGAQVIAGTGNFAYQNIGTVNGLYSNVIFMGKAYADFSLVVCAIPKFFL